MSTKHTLRIWPTHWAGGNRSDPINRIKLQTDEGVLAYIEHHGVGQGNDIYPTSKDYERAKLLAAAYTSYDKHCGERAVECAEGDLLGAALEACEAAIRYDESIAGRATRGEVDMLDSGTAAIAEGEDLDALYGDWIDKARAVIAKARRPDGT